MTDKYFENGAIHSAEIRSGKLTNPEAVSLASIAISLKRIADALDGVAYDHTPGADNSHHRASLTESIGTAIEQGILAGSGGR